MNIDKLPHILLLLFVFAAPCSLNAQNNVSVTINDGLNNGLLKNNAEESIGNLLTEINTAQSENRALNLSKCNLSQRAVESLAMLWENVPFRCIDIEIVERAIQNGSEYQIRNIPLILKPMDGAMNDDEYQEVVVSFDANGQITSFYLTLALNLYMNVMKSNLEVTDLRRRQLILDYVEQFRTAYNTKDISFLTQIFSDDALIITGNVIQSYKLDGQYETRVTYKKQSKQEYLNNLKNIFRAKKYIKVIFNDIKVVQAKNPNYYGVLLHQGWTSDNYHDTGYVFLLWDFSNEDAPKIHVRTWQPDYLDKAQTQKLPEDEIFSLSDFDL
ncbi:hypothetical protein CLV62_10811 [Dysgonomonas alginatilytica]|uniref:Nuclear transport factor 2 family protein n=1 Tax=Dysgonomonas alginatilytica TaxID=1605892 RepID=A0A2V3PRK9_9BACT|nr:nuclear transport factor 2 family protein [Dysgonomonas alginatilytica]PXV65013.1 hypothetical protein CLV62_10811 [Dysgonomonas alginatilytica]